MRADSSKAAAPAEEAGAALPFGESQKPPLIAVVGATAAGKTALGIAIAKAYKGEIVSADSMQLYEGLDIATAKPTAEEMQGIPHHLIGILPPCRSCSVAEYTEMAKEKITEIHARGRLPVLVGGTGLYIDALLENIQFAEMPSSEPLREELKAFAEQKGNAALLERLRACDPLTASRLHENNQRRIIRALEVFLLTGVPMSEYVAKSRFIPPPWEILRIGVGFSERALHYERIRERVDEMLEKGLVEEVSAEYESGRRKGTAASAIGYKELLPYLRQEASLPECVERIKQETCRYAKRQGTWFRRNEQIQWILQDKIRENNGNFEKSQKIIEKWGQVVL